MAIALIVMLLTATSTTRAEYDSNVVGRLTNVLISRLVIFAHLVDHTREIVQLLSIVALKVPIDGRQMLLSRALLAKSTGEMVNIGYDAHTCVNGWYRVHRIG